MSKPTPIPLVFLPALALCACVVDSQLPDDSSLDERSGEVEGEVEGEAEGEVELGGENPLIAEYSSLPVVPFGDVDGDGEVTAEDLAAIGLSVGLTLADAELVCPAAVDLDHSGTIEDDEYEAVVELLDARDQQPEVFAMPLHFVDESCSASATIALVEPGVRSGQTIHVAGISETTVVQTDTEGVLLDVQDGIVDVQVASDAPGREIDLIVARDGTHYTLTLPLIDRFPDAVTGHLPGEPVDPGEVPPEDPPPVPPVPPIPPDTPEDDCPQREMGCSALLVNFFHDGLEVWMAGKAQRLSDEFTDAGCEVHSWDINDHERARFWPRRHRRCHQTGHRHTPRCYRETPDEYETRRELYRQTHMVPAGAALNGAIEAFRASARAGKEWTTTLVTAHGSTSSSPTAGYCGEWANTSRTITLERSNFHKGNYDARNKTTCRDSDVDISCGAGNTPDAVRALNNTGAATCGGSPATNCPTRAGYELDVAVGSSGRCEDTVLAGIRLNEVDGAIEGHIATPTTSFGSLLDAQGWAAEYTDPGYEECK